MWFLEVAVNVFSRRMLTAASMMSETHYLHERRSVNGMDGLNDTPIVSRRP